MGIAQPQTGCPIFATASPSLRWAPLCRRPEGSEAQRPNCLPPPATEQPKNPKTQTGCPIFATASPSLRWAPLCRRPEGSEAQRPNLPSSTHPKPSPKPNAQPKSPSKPTRAPPGSHPGCPIFATASPSLRWAPLCRRPEGSEAQRPNCLPPPRHQPPPDPTPRPNHLETRPDSAARQPRPTAGTSQTTLTHQGECLAVKPHLNSRNAARAKALPNRRPRPLHHLQLLRPATLPRHMPPSETSSNAPSNKPAATTTSKSSPTSSCPEHTHLLVSEPATKPLATALQALKLSISKQSPQRPFWHDRYYDFNVFTQPKRVEKIKYIHRNPVTRGLVTDPDHWASLQLPHLPPPHPKNGPNLPLTPKPHPGCPIFATASPSLRWASRNPNRVPHLRDSFTVAKVGSTLPKAGEQRSATTKLPSSTRPNLHQNPTPNPSPSKPTRAPPGSHPGCPIFATASPSLRWAPLCRRPESSAAQRPKLPSSPTQTSTKTQRPTQITLETHPSSARKPPRVPHLRDSFTVAKVGSTLPKAGGKRSETTKLPSSTRPNLHQNPTANPNHPRNPPVLHPEATPDAPSSRQLHRREGGLHSAEGRRAAQRNDQIAFLHPPQPPQSQKPPATPPPASTNHQPVPHRTS